MFPTPPPTLPPPGVALLLLTGGDISLAVASLESGVGSAEVADDTKGDTNDVCSSASAFTGVLGGIKNGDWDRGGRKNGAGVAGPSMSTFSSLSPKSFSTDMEDAGRSSKSSKS